MNLYAESSAVVAWLLAERRGTVARELLAGANHVMSSELTLIECDRAVIRATAEGRLEEADAGDAHAKLAQAAEHWSVLVLDGEVVERARRPFPVEPLRTLDAMHLAAITVARRLVPGTAVLSFDDRVRRCAKKMGFEVLPA